MAGIYVLIKNVICSAIEEKRMNIRKTLDKAREDCLRMVNKHFDELEGRITSEVAS